MDGNTKIKTDRYDDLLRHTTIDAMLDALKKDDKKYRRFKMAKALLESVKKTMPECIVILYGY